jgi:hypothetical protein
MRVERPPARRTAVKARNSGCGKAEFAGIAGIADEHRTSNIEHRTSNLPEADLLGGIRFELTHRSKPATPRS